MMRRLSELVGWAKAPADLCNSCGNLERRAHAVPSIEGIDRVGTALQLSVIRER
jgi:hypothetical protein